MNSCPRSSAEHTGLDQTVLQSIRSDVLTMTEIDCYGLYEIVWALPAGDVPYPDFDVRKGCRWEDVRDLVIELVDNEDVHMVKMTNGRAERVVGDRKAILEDRTSWLPYGMASDTGYALAKLDPTDRSAS